MKSQRSLTIGMRLTLGFAALVALMLVLAAFAMLRIGAISNAMRTQETVQQQKLEPLYVAREALDQTGLAARNAYIFRDEAAAAKELAILDQQKALYLDALAKLAPVFKGDPQFDKVSTGLNAMAQELLRPRQLREAGKMEEYGTFLVNDCSPLRRQIVADIDAVLKSVQRESAQASEAAHAGWPCWPQSACWSAWWSAPSSRAVCCASSVASPTMRRRLPTASPMANWASKW